MLPNKAHSTWLCITLQETVYLLKAKEGGSLDRTCGRGLLHAGACLHCHPGIAGVGTVLISMGPVATTFSTTAYILLINYFFQI